MPGGLPYHALRIMMPFTQAPIEASVLPCLINGKTENMLDILRRSAGGVVGIFLIGLLVIAFALWGIADTFTGFSNATLASVGDEPIERDEYRLRLRQQIQQVSQQIGEPLSVG